MLAEAAESARRRRCACDNRRTYPARPGSAWRCRRNWGLAWPRAYGLHSAPVHAMVPLRMKHNLARLVVALAMLLFVSGTASAHRDVWVAVKSTVVYGPDGSAVGVRHTWAFDDMYSTFATQGLEQKKKGEFSRDELQPLAQVNVESLKEYDFFTYAKADGKKAAF